MEAKCVSDAGREESSRIIDTFFLQHEDLTHCRFSFEAAFRALCACFEADGTLFLCGNGGSHADALHIASELMKSFERNRPIPQAHCDALRADQPENGPLAEGLEQGLRAIPLGLNMSLASAVWNDKPQTNIHLAQELYVLARPGDMLLAISTSGNSRSVLHAVSVARLLGLGVIALTGSSGGELAEKADMALCLAGERTCEVQEQHQRVYHTLCLAIEAAFFPGSVR